MNDTRSSRVLVDPYTHEPARFLFTATDNRGHPGTFDYWEGTDGHVFISEIPSDLDRHYEGGYQKIPEDEEELAKVAREDAYRLDRIRELVPKGRFLEIGPWIGLTSYSAVQAGYDVSVLEMNQDCVDLLNRSRINATQTSDPANTLRASGERYDVIGLWHSIEHIPQPWEMIAAAAAAVSPGGLLVVAAPNPHSAQLRQFGKHWLHLDAPRHLHLLPVEMIEKIAAEQGLVTVERTSDDQLGELLDRFGWRFELHRRVRRIFGLRALAYRLLWRHLKRKHRKPGTLDGAAYTLMMMRPGEGPGAWDRPV
jgi:2-polyprenyl-3-methyl-5-hydroxy-6-metoxy-1,4-benzoquinol methylase